MYRVQAGNVSFDKMESAETSPSNSTKEINGSKQDSFGQPREPVEEFNDGCSDSTRQSLESQDVDSNQGTLGSESTEHIAKNFESIGIDLWERENGDLNSSAYSNCDFHVPPPSPFNTHFESFDAPNLDGDLDDVAPIAITSSNMQLVLYTGPQNLPPEDQLNKDSTALPGSCGLCNLGNTCYMNSGLQCLVATRQLVQFFLPDVLLSSPTSEQQSGASSISSAILNSLTGDPSSNLTFNLAQLMLKMWSGKYTSVQPQEFKASFGVRYPPFKDNMQHDCQEFLALLLDGLHEHLNTAGKSNAYALPLHFDKECNATAVAGCSKQQDLPLTCEQPGTSMTVSPVKNSNTYLATLLAKKQAEKFQKNHMEQKRSPKSPSTVPVAVVAPCSQTFNMLVGGGDTSHPALGKLHFRDIIKDTKTSNVNVLAPNLVESRPNNQLKFDSEKYGASSRHLLGTAAAVSPRSIRNLGLRDAVLVENPNNLHECSDKDEACSLLQEPVHKKLKQTNLNYNSQATATVTSEDFKDVCEPVGNLVDGNWAEDGEGSTSSYKKLKVMSSVIKNKVEESAVDMEFDMDQDESDSDIDSYQQEAAQTHWDQFLSANQSVIIDTFQGQFRSSVVCSVCNFKSVTFEPFMYLSVPLPQAMELQLEVTFISSNPCDPALKFLVTLNRTATVEKLREEVRKLSGRNEEADLQVCESLESRISKILSPQDQIEKSPRDRNIYVIEVPKLNILLSEQLNEGESAMETDRFPPPPSNLFPKDSDSNPLDLTPLAPPRLDNDLPWPKCNICLEEIEISDQPLKHGDNCECVLCASCLQECKAHQSDLEKTLKCPVCHKLVDPDVDFVVITSIDSKCKPSTWQLAVPVVFRVDEEGEEYNNRRTSILYGHPRLLHLPSKITGAKLYEAFEPYTGNNAFTLLQVGGNGLLCSICMYNSHCKGCTITNRPDEEVELQAKAMIAVRTNQPPSEPMPTLEHASMKSKRLKEVLSIHDCLAAFTKPEALDEDNPWFCPSCKMNQCATKTMTVWRYPPVLIIYLKRFVYHEGSSVKLDNKVTFPLDKLYLKEAGIGGRQGGCFFDLYSCVCHSGGACGSGHYIAYSKHPQSTDFWYKYNDDTVLKQRPQEEDYNSAYVLFYQKVSTPTVL